MAITQQAAEKTNAPAPSAGASRSWLPHTLALGSLALLFLWIYLRFAGKLYFILDDYIESELALSSPLAAAIRDSFTGAINWSGYRPVSYALRALLVHTFGIERLTGYYFLILMLHFANTLLAYHLVWRVARSALLAYIAAAFFLLLPAHNEAVLYFSASANLIALFFALLTLTFSLSATTLGARSVTRWWAILGAALVYWLAILSYEVSLPLILLVFLADWWLSASSGRMTMGEFLRHRVWLYAALGAALLLAMGMRLVWGGGLFGPPRSDYGTSFAPPHLAYGYTMLLSQMALLHNSPWLHLPDFVYTRDWMAWNNPRALLSVAMAFGLSLVTLWVAWRARPVSTKRRDALFWMAWGALWLLLVTLPFAALDGRNPENRYTYIPSFGAAILVTASFALLLGWVQRRGWQRIGVPVLILVASTGLAFYAWVDTSDVAEWERAATHARAFVNAASEMPLNDAHTIVQVGVPGDVGSAYVFTTDESFAAAMRLHGAEPDAHIVAGDLNARHALTTGNTPLLLLLYDRTGRGAQPASAALLCSEPPSAESCERFAVSTTEDDNTAPWYFVQVYNEVAPESGGLGMIVENANGPRLVSCWHYYDAERVTIDPSTFDNSAIAARCQGAFQAVEPMLTR